MLHRIASLIYKEFLSLWRDKKSRRVITLPPIIQLFVFAFAATLDVQNVTMGILNKDNGEHGFELTQRFHGSPTFKHIIYLSSVEEISTFIDNKRGSMVVHIDEQFSRDLDSGKQATVQLILDGRGSNSTQIVAGYAGSIIDQFNRDLLGPQGLTIQQQEQDEPIELVNANDNFASQFRHTLQQPVELIVRNSYNPNLLYYWFTIPSLCGVLVLVEALLLTALSVARERELGTFDQLLVSPLQPIEILIGKTIPPVIISMCAGTFILLAGIFIFQIPFTGSILALYLAMFVFVCSIVGFGLMISSLCSTQQQAILGAQVFMTPSISLSGFATPIENMPEWLQEATRIIPLRYFLVVAKGSFLKAMPFDIVADNIWPMAIIAIVTLTTAQWFFRHRLQ